MNRYFNAALGLTRIRTWREIALTLGASLGVLCIVAAIASVAFGIKPLVFRSGSMSPTITTGALAFAKSQPATDLKIGDIVSVKGAKDTRVTHRIQKIAMNGSQASLTLKGDANQIADDATYTVASADRVMFSVPKAGYVVAWLSEPVGIFLGGLLVGGLLIIAFRPSTSARQDGGRRKGSVKRGLPASVVALCLIGAGGLGLVRADPTWAYFKDSASTTTENFSTHTVVSQLPPDCKNINGFLLFGNVARLTWVPDSRYEYEWELRKTSGSVVADGVVQDSSNTVTLNISTGLIGVNANYDVVIRARLAASTEWVAATTTTTRVHRTSILFLGAAMRCHYS